MTAPRRIDCSTELAEVDMGEPAICKRKFYVHDPERLVPIYPTIHIRQWICMNRIATSSGIRLGTFFGCPVHEIDRIICSPNTHYF
jgi:hypothetical protein